MNSRPRLFLVDVFAESPYAGNQLAVVVGTDPGQWPASRMQAFAREMNFSETTFASPSPEGGAFDVRIFTPAEELPFAGHPTLGTAWVLRNFFCGNDAPSLLSLRLGVGVVPVEFDDGALVRMRPRSPELGAAMDGAAMAAHLGLDASAIDPRHACRRVSIGIEFVIVPLGDLASLRAAKPKSLPVAGSGRALGVLVFAAGAPAGVLAAPSGGDRPAPGVSDVSARMFFEALGIREDPATGSAAACLAAWLSSERYFGSGKVNVREHQGHEIGRPSCLYLTAEPAAEGFAVSVAGKVVLVADGEVV